MKMMVCAQTHRHNIHSTHTQHNIHKQLTLNLTSTNQTKPNQTKPNQTKQEFKRKKEPTDELEDRKQQLELKMQLLVVQVCIFHSILKTSLQFYKSILTSPTPSLPLSSPLFPHRSKQNNSLLKPTPKWYKRKLTKRRSGHKS